MVFSVSSHRSVDVVVVDTARSAGAALGAPRTDAESTHVLCRHLDETTPDFTSRVLRRIERIQRTRRLRSLWYVGGTEAAQGRSPVPLLRSLLSTLEGGGCLTLLGPGKLQSAVFEWVDALMDDRPSNVTVRAQLYTDASDGYGASHHGSPRGRSLPAGAPASLRSSPAGAQPGWRTVDAAQAHNATQAHNPEHGARLS